MWTLIVAIVCVLISIVLFFQNKKPTETKSTKDSTTPAVTTTPLVQTEKVKSIVTSTKIESTKDCEKEGETCGSCSCQTPAEEEKNLKILYASQIGTAKKWASTLENLAQQKGFKTSVENLGSFDPDELTVITSPVVFVISTYTGGEYPETAQNFSAWLKDVAQDFRVSKNHFQNLRFAVFGIGNKIYGKNFNKASYELDRIFCGLGAQNITREVGAGDTDAGVEVSEAFEPWVARLWKALELGPSQVVNAPNKTIKISDEPDEDADDDLDEEPVVDLEELVPSNKNRGKKGKDKNNNNRPKGKKTQKTKRRKTRNSIRRRRRNRRRR